MNLKPYIYLSLALTIISSCKTKKPATIVNNSPKVYKTQIDSLLDIVKIKDTVRLADSAGTAIPSEFVATVNFNLRKPNYVIIHHTAQDSAKQTLNTFTLTRTQVSAHYVVSRDGKVYHMLNDYLRSWHAGVSKWGSVTDMNSCSIGIELDNNGVQPFQDAQVKSLILLLAKLKRLITFLQQILLATVILPLVVKPIPALIFHGRRWLKAALGTGAMMY